MLQKYLRDSGNPLSSILYCYTKQKLADLLSPAYAKMLNNKKASSTGRKGGNFKNYNNYNNRGG